MKPILDYLKDNGIQDQVVHTRKKLGGDIPVLLSEVMQDYYKYKLKQLLQNPTKD